MPPAAVYFVKPLRMAAMPASLTGTGVSKSGSPEAKAITSTPRAAIALASAVLGRGGGGGEPAPPSAKLHRERPPGRPSTDAQPHGAPARTRRPPTGAHPC